MLGLLLRHAGPAHDGIARQTLHRARRRERGTAGLGSD
jgi:hypothetical protein